MTLNTVTVEPSNDNGADALATLVQLARRAREAKDDSELAFVLVNETIMLAPYQQAALWLRDDGVKTLSGVVSPDANAPYVQWLKRVFQHLSSKQNNSQPQILNAFNLPMELITEWRDWLPAQGLWLPIPAIGKKFHGGGVILARDKDWTAGELALLTEWASIWAQSRALMSASSMLSDKVWIKLGKPLNSPEHHRDWRERLRWQLGRKRARIAIGFAIVCLFPVKLTVLAPAELIPLKPAIIRAPLDGVVERVLVTPNEMVSKNTPLFEFDRTSIRNKLSIAENVLSTAEAEYRQKSQQALFDPESKSQLAVLQGQIAEKQSEVTYLRKLNERSVIVAPRAGVVLFDDPTELEGKPVVTGERVMMVADQHKVEVEAWLSPTDAIELPDKAEVKLYLNADPLNSIEAELHYIAHEAVERPDGKFAYRVRASLIDKDEKPRVGLKGTAKLEGEYVLLGYWILRRPLAGIRSWLGI